MHRCRLTLIDAGPLGGPAQVVDVDDVVALEHARRPVAGERHDGVRRRPAADQVPDAAPPQVVHDAARETERGAGFRPELPEVPDAAAVAVEAVGTTRAAGRPGTRDDRRGLASVDGEDASGPVLAAPRPERDDPPLPVLVAPLERPPPPDPPRREELEADDVA